jgi:hypothetical protein
VVFLPFSLFHARLRELSFDTGPAIDMIPISAQSNKELRFIRAVKELQRYGIRICGATSSTAIYPSLPPWCEWKLFGITERVHRPMAGGKTDGLSLGAHSLVMHCLLFVQALTCGIGFVDIRISWFHRFRSTVYVMLGLKYIFMCCNDG